MIKPRPHTPAAEAVEHATQPWLFLATTATILPHFLHLPAWLSLCSTLIFGWSLTLWQGRRHLPRRGLLTFLVIAISGGILLEYRALFGRESGIALLVVMSSLKLLEVKSRRDAVVLLTLAYFLLLTHYLNNQSIPTGLWLLACFWLITATLIRLHGDADSPPSETMRYAAQLSLQSLPLMLALFLLFPRISGPLWGLPHDAHGARSGLSDKVRPGSIANLALSSEIALRARFDGAPPTRSQLYWRGPVLEYFDGATWQTLPPRIAPVQLEARSPGIAYESTLEASNQRWLLALDAPLERPPESLLDGQLTVSAKEAVRQRQRFRFSASLDYRYNVTPSANELRHNLRLPAGSNPQAHTLAARWRDESVTPTAIVARALRHFSDNNFSYTLRPPLLGQHGIDEFLFQTQRGFCEHYASAFVFLMRAAGIPARIVAGYQGGEINPVDGYVIVRQSDAHAWAEVWLAGQGWRRIDPTAAVAPERIESGIAEALAGDEPLPMLIDLHSDWLIGLRDRWEALNNAWNQQILGFNPERQRDFLARLGLLQADWRQMALLLGGVVGLLLAAITLWTLYQRPRLDPATRLWRKALRHLARSEVHCAPWETPLALARRVERETPSLSEPVTRLVDAYLYARYAPHPDAETRHRALSALRAAVAQLSRGRKF